MNKTGLADPDHATWTEEALQTITDWHGGRRRIIIYHLSYPPSMRPSRVNKPPRRTLQLSQHRSSVSIVTAHAACGSISPLTSIIYSIHLFPKNKELARTNEFSLCLLHTNRQPCVVMVTHQLRYSAPSKVAQITQVYMIR